MHDRRALGPADVDDARLAALVADSLGVDEVELLSSRADLVAYDLDAITTAGRYWVSARAMTPRGERRVGSSSSTCSRGAASRRSGSCRRSCGSGAGRGAVRAEPLIYGPTWATACRRVSPCPGARVAYLDETPPRLAPGRPGRRP